MSSPITPSQIAVAIAQAEGYGQPGAIPTTANNPGDLALGDIGYGTTGNGITIFPTADAGATALVNQVNKMLDGTSSVYSQDQTLSQVGSIYSGGDSNWAANVSASLGVPASTTLGQLGSGTSSTSNPSTQGLDSSTLQSAMSALGLGDGIPGVTSNSIPGVGSVTPSGTGASQSQSSILTRGTMIVIGMIMVAAGVFSFKTSQIVVQTAGRVGRRVAEFSA